METVLVYSFSNLGPWLSFLWIYRVLWGGGKKDV